MSDVGVTAGMIPRSGVYGYGSSGPGTFPNALVTSLDPLYDPNSHALLSLVGAPLVNVLAFGADPLGVKDSAPAFNTAVGELSSVAPTGGIIYVPAGRYLLNSTVTIGNGSSAGPSAYGGIRLIGPSYSGFYDTTATLYAGSTHAPASLYTNSALNPMVNIQGPIVGCGIENIEIDGNSHATQCLNCTASQYGVFKAIDVRNATGFCIGTKASTFAVGAGNHIHNYWIHVSIHSAPPGFGGAIYQDGNGSSTTTDSTNDIWDHLSLRLQGFGGYNTVGIGMAAADGITFTHVQIWIDGIASQVIGLFLNYGNGVSTNWPGDIVIQDIDFGSASMIAAFNNGTPGATLSPNRIFQIRKSNGIPANPALTNLDWGYLIAHP